VDITAGECLIETTWTAAALGDPAYNRPAMTTRHNLFDGSDVAVTHSWSYGAPWGNPVSRTTEIAGLGTAGQHFEIGYRYDGWGNRSGLDFPTWNDCRQSAAVSAETLFDGPWAKELRLIDTLGGSAEDPDAAAAYHPTGRVDALTYGTIGTPVTRTETADGSGMARPAAITLSSDGAPSQYGAIDPFDYDASGNVRQMDQRYFAYDGLNRLIREYTPDTSPTRSVVPTRLFGFDRWGNIESTTGSTLDGTIQFDLTFAMEKTGGIPTTNRIDSVDDAVSRTVVSLGWDDRGNLVTLPGVGGLRAKIFDWSIDDRLTQSIDTATGAVRRFAYDSAGERVLEWWDAGTGTEARIFIRDEAGAVVSEWRNVPDTTDFGASVDYLSLAGLPVAEIHHDGGGDRMLFVSADHIGSPRVVFDDHGNLVDHFVFEPFGEIRENNLDPPATTHLFTGHERDVGEMASGLDYMHARYYSPFLARFVSVDPVQGKVGSSQSWNRYSYVLNNPIALIDPDGREVAVAIRPVQDAQGAGHAYIVVTPTGANRASERFSNYLEGKNRFILSGSNGSRMVEGFRQHNRLVSFVNHPMDEMGDATQLFNVRPPNGLSMEEFERSVLDAFESYESGRLHYNSLDFNFSGRNSNAFASGLLSEAGVDIETLPPVVGLDMFGWGDPIQMKATPGEEGDTKAWLERMKQGMAAQRAGQ